MAEAKELSLKVAAMKRYKSGPDPDLVAFMNQNSQLEQLWHQQRCSLWGVQSAVSDWLVRAADCSSR